MGLFTPSTIPVIRPDLLSQTKEVHASNIVTLSSPTDKVYPEETLDTETTKGDGNSPLLTPPTKVSYRPEAAAH